MPSTLDRCYRRENLQLAWNWIRSNPAPSYKNFFRQFYANYAIADQRLLDELASRLKQNKYEPAHACKVNFPKGSGGLRPYSLLTVEDQIVYQAFANVIADRFYPKMSKSYGKEVFSNIIAGPSSDFFYQDWKRGYAACNRAARKAFNSGLTFTARFDLTACYDSLDHRVLQHFLEGIGCDIEFRSKFVAILAHWTATGRKHQRIYQGHGIPQGPISSHLVAELVLHYFDKHQRKAGIRYLRYVDDIRLFAKTEKKLRHAVNELDLLSKDIGLFPQSAKIAIHEVTSIEDELKSISRPDDDEGNWDSIADNQDLVHGLLAELSPRYRVADATRFKYLLGNAIPKSPSNERLWRVFENHPELYGNILSYFQKYMRLPKKDARRLVNLLKAEEMHAVKIAEMIRTADGRLKDDAVAEVDKVVRKYLPKMNKLPTDLAAVVGCWGMKRDLLDSTSVRSAIDQHPEWYSRAVLTLNVDNRAVPQPGYNELLFARLDDRESDVALAAATQLGVQQTTVPAHLPMHFLAGHLLEEFGILEGTVKQVCGVTRAFDRFLGGSSPRIDWRGFFGRDYRQAEAKAIRWTGYLKDATAWVNLMDVFCDIWLNSLHRNDTSLGGYTLGKIGSTVYSLGPRQLGSYPKIFQLAKEIHDKRGESDLSHPKKKRGKSLLGATSYISFAYFKRAKIFASAALKEMAAKWPMPVATVPTAPTTAFAGSAAGAAC